MNQEQENTTSGHRIARLERDVAEIRLQLDDIRAIITSALDAVFDANDHRRTEIDALTEQIEERLEPVFHQVFPRQRDFLSDVERVMRDERRGG